MIQFILEAMTEPEMIYEEFSTDPYVRHIYKNGVYLKTIYFEKEEIEDEQLDS
jgi:hypothetical protein